MLYLPSPPPEMFVDAFDSCFTGLDYCVPIFDGISVLLIVQLVVLYTFFDLLLHFLFAFPRFLLLLNRSGQLLLQHSCIAQENEQQYSLVFDRQIFP